MRAPDFWNERTWRERTKARLLSPLGWCYSTAVAINARRATPARVPVPVICIGNLTAGGTGKTPIAVAIGRMLAARGRKPFFLSRGYGGKLAGPIRVQYEHRAADVGDEPLLLAAEGPTVVARNRALGAKLAAALGAGAIVMDDGHQNFALAKDLSLVVIDAVQGYGNGRVLPAGPLREFVRQGLRRADAVIVTGDGEVDLRGFAGPVLHAHIRPTAPAEMKGARVVGFAGIGRPEKFFHALEACGAVLVSGRRFADHHVYTASEIAHLQATARTHDARLVTTAKDFARLTETQREGIAVLPIEAAFDDEAGLQALLDRLPPRET